MASAAKARSPVGMEWRADEASTRFALKQNCCLFINLESLSVAEILGVRTRHHSELYRVVVAESPRVGADKVRQSLHMNGWQQSYCRRFGTTLVDAEGLPDDNGDDSTTKAQQVISTISLSHSADKHIEFHKVRN